MNTLREFAIASIETGQLNALVKNIMAQMGIDDPVEAVRRVNSKEWIVSQPDCRWREENGVIYFTVTSDGTTGPKWIERLEKKGFQLSKWAKDVLNSPDFKPTRGVMTEVAVLQGKLFKDDDRITKNIRAEAERRNLQKPNAEVACLIRENFSDEDIKAMGLWWIVVFHEPIKDSDGDPNLLSADRARDGRWLSACCDRPESRWDPDDGFAFAVSQVSSN